MKAEPSYEPKPNYDNEQAREEIVRHQRKLETLGALAGDMAHEINNPVNGIMNYAQLIKDQLESRDGDISNLADEIINETDRISTLVCSLLGFTRRNNHNDITQVSMAEVVEACLTIINPSMRHDQISFEVDIPENLPPVRCRPSEIEQVLMVLLSNAREASNRRHPEYNIEKIVRLSLRLYRDEFGIWLRTTVEDHGADIPAHLLAKIFNPFFMTRNKDDLARTGLPISHRVVEEQGGRLLAGSGKNGTIRFHLDLAAVLDSDTKERE